MKILTRSLAALAAAALAVVVPAAPALAVDSGYKCTGWYDVNGGFGDGYVVGQACIKFGRGSAGQAMGQGYMNFRVTSGSVSRGVSIQTFYIKNTAEGCPGGYNSYNTGKTGDYVVPSPYDANPLLRVIGPWVTLQNPCTNVSYSHGQVGTYAETYRGDYFERQAYDTGPFAF